MKSISLSNFRRFKDFPKLNFGEITLLVGANNAGKSTVHRALTLLTENIRNLSVFNDFHYIIGTLPCKFDISSEGNFSRAHNNTTSEPIKFSLGFGENKFIPNKERFQVSFTLSLSNPNEKQIKIDEIEIGDTELFLHLSIHKSDYSFKWIEINEPTSTNKNWVTIDSELWDYTLSRSQIISSLDPEEVEQTIYYYQALEEERFNCLSIGYQNKQYKTVEIKDVFPIDITEPHTSRGVACLMESILYAHEKNVKCGITWYDDSIQYRILESSIALERCINSLKIDILPVHTLDKVAVFLSNHPLFSQIEAFVLTEQQRLWIPASKGGDSHMGKTKREYFIELLEMFKIASDYSIESIGGEAYTFKIMNSNGQLVDIGDIGSGAFRLIEIFLFILNSDSKTISIAEPEQNLHPKYQSILADLFLYANVVLGKKFIIETHSEYLIRKTQVLVSNFAKEKKIDSMEELEKINPFKVFYFPEEGEPYDMKYKITGHFEETFGEGFFDESSKCVRELMLKIKK